MEVFYPAARYVFRGLLIHNLLPYVWELSLSDKGQQIEEAQILQFDEDDPDLAPAFKQRIRASKVLQVISGENALAPDLYSAKFSISGSECL